jgi:hypothetical protein
VPAVATETVPPDELTVTLDVPLAIDVGVVLAGVAHVPSPLKKFELDGVPVTGFAAIFVAVEIKYPLVGSVPVVVPVTVRVVEKAPENVRFPPTVIVLLPTFNRVL